MTSEIFIGVYSCKAGWFYTALTNDTGCETGVAPDIDWIRDIFNKTKLILIDIPVGLACHPAISTWNISWI